MNLTWPIRPMEHQSRAHTLSKEHFDKFNIDAYGFLAEMGCGKTFMCWRDVIQVYAEGRIDRVVIFAGKGSYRSWTDLEIPTITPPEVRYVMHLWTGSTSSKTKEELRRLAAPGKHLRILVMNIEAVGASPRARAAVGQFVDGGPCAIVTDESTLIKNHEAVRTEELVHLGKRAVMRRIATGSPITKNPLDLWGQFLFLGEGLLGFRSYFAFRARYAILKEIQVSGRTVRVPVAYHNLPELEERVKLHSFRITKAECLDLPPKVYEYVDVDMSVEQHRMYNEFRRDCVTSLQDGTMSTTQRMTQVMQLHRILCGHFLDDDTKTVMPIPSLRASMLADKLEEVGDQSVIIWCSYRYDVKLMREELERRHGAGCALEYHGGVSPDGCAAAVADFQARRKQFIILTQAKGSKGITLTAAQVVAYYSNTFDLEHRIQSEDRAHRIGQRNTVTYLDTRVRGTVDERVIANLRAKRDIATIVLGDEITEWLS